MSISRDAKNALHVYAVSILSKIGTCTKAMRGFTGYLSANVLTLFMLFVLALGGGELNAYTLITSPNNAYDQALIAATTAQFNATVVTNPFFPGTYNVLVNGINPSYNAPLTPTQLLQEIDNMAAYNTTVDSYTYLFGWADGTTYTRAQDAEQADFIFAACTSTMTFATPPPGISTTSWIVPRISSTTCQFVTNYIADSIWAILDSTPTIVPGLWQ